MSDYVKSTDFASKDTLPSGDSAKIVRGTEIDAEFEALEVAIASKANTSDVSYTYAPLNSPTFTGSPVLPTGTTAVTQSAGDNDTSVATTAFVTTAVAALGYPSFKNRIINGAMAVNQRGTLDTAVTANSGVFGSDRFGMSMVASGKGTIQQSSTAPAGFTRSLLFTSSAATSVGATDYYSIFQRIEGNNVADLGWGAAGAATVTLSFWVRSSLTGTFGGSIFNGAANRSFPFSYTISAANTWEQKTVTIAGDTTGTWAKDTSNGMTVNFSLGMGSTYSGTANAWAAGDYESVTGATSVVGTNGATFYITGVQLEKGSTATSFDYRPYGTELSLCQRYYSQINDFLFRAYQVAGSFFGATITLPTTMRATPTMAIVGTPSYLNASSMVSVVNFGSTACEVYATATASGDAKFSVSSSANYITASAEL